MVNSAPALYISPMAAVAFILMAIGMAGTVAVLLTGIIGMARGGAFNRKWGNRLMRYRVVFQAFALACFAIGLTLLKS